MSDPSHGLLDRLVEESFAHWVKTNLTGLGWFDTGRQHKPIVFRTEPFKDDESIPLNALIVSVEHVDSDSAELGSTFSQYRHQAWVDFYGESKAVATHLIGDVVGFLTHGAPDEDAPAFPILRWDQTPDPGDDRAEAGYCTVEDPQRIKEANRSDARDTRYWYAAACDLIEYR